MEEYTKKMVASLAHQLPTQHPLLFSDPFSMLFQSIILPYQRHAAAGRPFLARALPCEPRSTQITHPPTPGKWKEKKWVEKRSVSRKKTRKTRAVIRSLENKR